MVDEKELGKEINGRIEETSKLFRKWQDLQATRNSEALPGVIGEIMIADWKLKKACEKCPKGMNPEALLEEIPEKLPANCLMLG